MLFEQNFGERVEFRCKRLWFFKNRKLNGEIKCGGRMKLVLESLSNLKQSDQVFGINGYEGKFRGKDGVK